MEQLLPDDGAWFFCAGHHCPWLQHRSNPCVSCCLCLLSTVVSGVYTVTCSGAALPATGVSLSLTAKQGDPGCPRVVQVRDATATGRQPPVVSVAAAPTLTQCSSAGAFTATFTPTATVDGAGTTVSLSVTPTYCSVMGSASAGKT
jgi:hypothetical protein